MCEEGYDYKNYIKEPESYLEKFSWNCKTIY